MTVLVGDCVARMRELEDASVDAIVTDPPYGIGFMGHEWDQPGEHGPVRSNGKPGPYASGAAAEGPHDAGGPAALERQMARAQRRVAHGKPTSGAGHERERQAARNGVKFGGPSGKQHTGGEGGSSDAGGAMMAGRYDLSPTANRRFQAWCEAWATEALRVLKPGGHMLVFGGTRTYHRMASGLEDAGFEIRDCLMWLYGSGFPKSLNVEREIDKAVGAELAEPWQGWGTALKPGWEPIVVARKPLLGTVAGNVLVHGTGALNVDACRVAGGEREYRGGGGLYGSQESISATTSMGRWPGNVVLSHSEDCVLIGERQVRSDGHSPARRGGLGYGSGAQGQEGLEERRFDGERVQTWACVPGCPVRLLDDQSGARGAAAPVRGTEPSSVTDGIYRPRERVPGAFHSDVGGASRFYYCAKASRAEREAGLDGFDRRPMEWSNGEENPGSFQSSGTDRSSSNSHPTVKPIDLMRWLVRLVTPAGGRVLDMFLGSGTTGCAAELEGFEFVGIERDEEYAAIAEARMAFWREHPTGLPVEQALAAEGKRRRVRESGQMGLAFD